MTESRSVAQVQNPVTAPKRVPHTLNLERMVGVRFKKFCLDNGYTQGDVADAALSDYMDLYERTQSNTAQGEPQDIEASVADDPDSFDPFAGSVPE